MKGWLVMWACYCSDVRDEVADLPDVCPGHGSERMDVPWQDPKQWPPAAGHRCHRRRCAA